MRLLDREDELSEVGASRADRVQELRRAYLAGTLTLEVPEHTSGLDRLLLDLLTNPPIRLSLGASPPGEER
jgi:hypothetical protein